MTSLETTRLQPAEEAFIPENDRHLSAEYKFAFSEHTFRSAKAMGEAVKDCDLIAIECVVSPEERIELTHGLTELASADLPRADRIAISRRLDENGFGLWSSIVGQFAGTGKEIALVDVDLAPGEGNDVVRNFFKTRYELREAQAEERPNSELRSLILDSVEAGAAMATARESVVADQLRDLGYRHPSAKIGVILGAMHTPVQHMLATEASTSRIFVAEDRALQRPEKTRFSYEEELSRQRSILGKEVIDPTVLDRALLDYIFDYHGFTNDDVFGNNYIGRNSPRTLILDRMSDQEVEDALTEIDHTKGRRQENPDNVSRIRQIYSETEAVLQGCIRALDL